MSDLIKCQHEYNWDWLFKSWICIHCDEVAPSHITRIKNAEMRVVDNSKAIARAQRVKMELFIDVGESKDYSIDIPVSGGGSFECKFVEDVN